MHSARLPLQPAEIHLPATFGSQPPLVSQCELPPKESRSKSGSELAIEAFLNTIERLERLLDQENTALRAHKLAALLVYNHKKRQALLELHRTIGTARGLRFGDFGIDNSRLTRLRQKLQENLDLLQTHLDASTTIAAIIARTIEEHESDGTYTSQIRSKDSRI